MTNQRFWLKQRQNVPYGGRQGSILGPTLFIIFMSGAFRYCLKDLENAVMVGFADDNTGNVADGICQGLYHRYH